jgi:hypothetical protein
MRRIVTAMAVASLVAGAVSPAIAADEPKRPAATGPRNVVQGKIAEVDASGGRLTLEDGTVLVLTPSVTAPRETLKKGALVQARYAEKNGQKVVTGLTVQPRN